MLKRLTHLASNPRTAAGRRAFTLVELVMVMVVVTVIIALVAPSFSGFIVGRRNRDTATLIVALANHARTQAISESRVYRLNIDLNKREMWLTVANAGVFQPPSSDYGDQYNWADDIKLDADVPKHDDGNYLEFRPSGRNDSGHFWLTDRLGGSMEVASETATEQFHILTDDEIRNER